MEYLYNKWIIVLSLFLVQCNFSDSEKQDNVKGEVTRRARFNLGKNYYRAIYEYKYEFKGNTYSDKATFWKGDSKLRNVNKGDTIDIRVVHLNDIVKSSEFLESNFERSKSQAGCFIKGNYQSGYFYSINSFVKDDTRDEYRYSKKIFEKGPIFWGWNNVFIKRVESEKGEYFPLLSCDLTNGVYIINSKKDNVDHRFFIKPDNYLIHEFEKYKMEYILKKD